jgi:hypothetical protein
MYNTKNFSSAFLLSFAMNCNFLLEIDTLSQSGHRLPKVMCSQMEEILTFGKWAKITVDMLGLGYVRVSGAVW